MFESSAELIGLLILLTVILIVAKLVRRSWELKWKERFSMSSILYSLLIFWIIVGFFNGKDYSTQFGCMSFSDVVPDATKLKYLFSSLLFSTVGYVFRRKNFGLALLIVELLIWMYKFLLVKGGYVVGIGGVADIGVVFYDTIAIFLRLSLIRAVMGSKLRLVYLLLCVFLIISLRLF